MFESRSFIRLTAVMGAIVGATVLVISLDLSERLFELSRRYEPYDLDEVVFFLPLFLAVGLAYVFGDRARRARQEAAERKVREDALRQANATLEGRVAERTAELAAANERLRLEAEERRRAELAAEAASSAKSDFLAKMSHEIRTPLNGALGMIDLVLREDLPEKAGTWLGLARYSAQSLLGIIDDVLDVSKIESGMMRLEPVEFETRPEFERLLASLAPEARRRGLTFSWTIAPGLPARLRGDLGRLRQILVNLVGNACKYTEQGGVEVAIRLPSPDWLAERSLAAGAAPLFVTVRDTGLGIPADKLEAIFESFFQAPTGLNGGGVGLGLAIARELVRLMGGDVSVRSEPGRGSEFEFWVVLEGVAHPAVPEAPAAVPTASPSLAPLPPLRALVVEDNPVNRELAVALLVRRGLAVESAAGGRPALERLAGEPFDIVFMDVSMPDLDGEAATRLIRAGTAGEAARSVTIVALTAHALKGDRERFLAAGMDDYLTKPLDPVRLEEALARAAAGRASPSV